MSDTAFRAVSMQRSRSPNPVFGRAYGCFRQLLAQCRREAGLSQRDLAARLGKSPSHVAMIERGQRRVDALEFYRIAKALNVDPARLYAQVVALLDQDGSCEEPASQR